MKNLRIIALVLSLLMLTVAFSGCQSTPTSDQPSPSPDKTVAENADSKVYVVGTNAEFPPFEFMNDKGEPDGFDMALIKECAKIAGIEIKIENMEFKSLIAAMETGKVDIIASGMTITDERKGQVDFTDSYYTAVQKIVLRAGDESIKGVENLEGKKIGVQEGTTGDFIATDDIKNSDVSRFKKGVDAVMELKNKKIDAVLIDKNPAEEYVKANGDSIYAIDSGCDPENYGFAVKKGNKDLLDKLNAALNVAKENGTYDALIKQYIN